MRRAWTWWLAWGLFVLVVALTIATLLVDLVTSHPSELEESSAGTVGLVIAFEAFAVVGALVASRQPRNAVGWLFLGSPLFALAGAFAEEYTYRALVADPGAPGALVAAWFYSWTWFPALGCIVLVPLFLPDGRLPGRRWRPLFWVCIAFGAAATIGAAVVPGEIDSAWPGSHPKPLTIGALDGVAGSLGGPAGLAFVGVLVGLLASVVVRFRRSRGDERQQLKWMLVAVALLVAEVVVTEVLLSLPDGFGDVFFAIAVASIPVAAGVAMLKYRLYDVDVVIRRTLVYGSLTVLLGALYAGAVVVAQALLQSLTGGSNLAIAVSTLLVAALFLPVRSKVQRFVDRRFYRRRYDARRTLEAFGARLREQLELDGLRVDLEGVVHETVQPAHVSVWLRGARP